MEDWGQLFAKDIVTIDGIEYKRDDLDKIRSAFEGTDGSNPFPPYFPSYTVSGNHEVLGFDVTSFCVEYDRKTKKIMDYILATPYPFGAAVASLSAIATGLPMVYDDGRLTSAEYWMGDDKKIVLGYPSGNPSAYNIILLWE